MRTPVFYWIPRKSPAERNARSKRRDEPDRYRRPEAPRAVLAVITTKTLRAR